MKKAQIYRRKIGRLKYFTQEEVTLFLREAGRPKYHKRQGSKLDLLFSLMYYLGLRESEAVRIKLADFHKSPTGDMLIIRGPRSPPPGSWRIVRRMCDRCGGRVSINHDLFIFYFVFEFFQRFCVFYNIYPGFFLDLPDQAGKDFAGPDLYE